MDRRAFLAGTGTVLLAAPLGVEAQPAGEVFRVGSLGVGAAELLRQSLSEVGYVERRNLVIEGRDAAGEPEPFDARAADLVRLKVDVGVACKPAATFGA